jgi:DNA-binding NtrC family response regulator
MPSVDGVDLLAHLKKRRPGACYVLITAHAAEPRIELEAPGVSRAVTGWSR